MSSQTYQINGYAGEQIRFDGNLATHCCPSCYIAHAYPLEMDKRARRFNSGDYPKNYITIYCPNGHGWSYTANSELEQAKRRAELAEEALRWTQDSLNRVKGERAHAEAQARGYKGALVKTQKRIAAGVCPYCNRTFADSRMARHIASKHKETP